MKFKVGDYVKVIKSCDGESKKDKASIGKIYKIFSIDEPEFCSFPYRIECLDKRMEGLDWTERPYGICKDDEIILATDGEILAWLI
ncbi:MAG: hypothetical protein IMZ52_02800 [Actinobacteria bacterium]|nr:hypothetical protein [Actinomycetota bacterium]